MHLQQALDRLPQFDIGATGRLHKGGPISGRLRERRLQQLICLLPLLKSHTAFIVWRSQGAESGADYSIAIVIGAAMFVLSRISCWLK